MKTFQLHGSISSGAGILYQRNIEQKYLIVGNKSLEDIYHYEGKLGSNLAYK